MVPVAMRTVEGAKKVLQMVESMPLAAAGAAATTLQG